MNKKVFISYSHKDEAYKEDFEDHLSQMKRNGAISLWNDRKINPGQDWKDEIDNNLIQADIIVFLVSSSFIASDYCYEVEFKKALERHQSGEAILIPIIIRACDWNDSPLGKVQGLPKDAEPIAKWDDEDSGWLNVVQGLKKIIADFQPSNKTLMPVQAEEQGIRVKEKFSKWLEDTEVVFTHRMVDKIKLSDVFIWPDLKVLSDLDRKKQDYTTSQTLLKNKSYHFVLGEEQQGKTALLKYLFNLHIQNKQFPVYVDATNLNKSDLNIVLKSAVESQYENLALEDYLAINDKVLLIDNLHEIKLNTKYQNVFIDSINEVFNNVVITAHDSFNLVAGEVPGLNDYESYELLGMGHLLREEMVLKWVTLGVEESINETDMYAECDQVKARLDAIIKKNIVPPKPIYVLLLLQMFEAYSSQNIELTSFGHCYQQLIYTSLDNAKIKKVEFEKYFNVLTEISWAIYLNKGPLNPKEIDAFFNLYEKEFLPVDREVILQKLTKHSILASTEDGLKFKYPYIYYFFVGKKIADSYFDSDDVKSEVEHLLDTLHREDSANILIFITHHTKNTWILKKIQAVLKELFNEQKPAVLTQEQLGFMGEFIDAIPELVIEKREVQEERDSRNKDLDRIEREELVENEEDFDGFETLANLNKTFKGMEMAGQIIRNRHANLSRDELFSLADNGASAGLRALDFFIEISDTAKHEVVKYIEKKLESHPSLTDRQLQDHAKMAYLHLTYGVISGIIKKIASSIGSKDAMVIYEHLEEAKGSPAFSLIKLSIELQHKRVLDISSIEAAKLQLESNPICMRILKEMVVQHIYMFPVDYRKQQKLSTSLGISVQGQQKMKRKLIGKG